MTFIERRLQRLRAEDAHAIATAVCPTCQTAPGTPCHHDGQPVAVHPSRQHEADRSPA